MTDRFPVTEEQLARYHEDGFLILEHLFDSQEMSLLRDIARQDLQLASEAKRRRDGGTGEAKLTVRNDLGDDIYSAIVRSHRITDPMEQFLGGEVYHYHHKMNFKEPQVGGAWEWHQDYGYWYNNGCLYPLMASCMIAVDEATQANGCLQVLRGSHHLGRLNHGPIGDQTGADQEQVSVAREQLELVHCELAPGSVVFFHCNLLHSSAQNRSADPRWALICCYNAARNNPYKESHHPRYSFLEKWPESRILETGQRQLAALQAGS